jgi:hypothetical protein
MRIPNRICDHCGQGIEEKAWRRCRVEECFIGVQRYRDLDFCDRECYASFVRAAKYHIGDGDE